MIALDYIILVQIVAFLVFWFVLTRLLFRPSLALLNERERRTEGVKAETASLMEECERLRKEYEHAIAEAKEEGRAAKERITQEARQTRERLLSQAREEAARALEAVRVEIQKELQTGRELVTREAGVLAKQIAERILGREIG